MDMTIAGFPMLFWFKDQWHTINGAGIANSAAYVEIVPPHAELEAKLKKNLIEQQSMGDTYTLDIANRRQCFLADLSSYESWKAAQTENKS